MPAHTDPAKRFRIRYEPNRKGLKYVVLFMKRFADRVDPSNTNTTLRKSRSFATKTEAKAWGERVADQAEALGRIEIPLNMQIQILGIANQLQEAGGNPISLLMNATKIQKYVIPASHFDPLADDNEFRVLNPKLVQDLPMTEIRKLDSLYPKPRKNRLQINNQYKKSL